MPPEKDKKKKGGMSRSTLMIAGVLAGVAVYIWYRNKQAAAAAAASNVATLPSSMPAGAVSTTTGPVSSAVATFLSLSDWMNAVQTWGNSLGYDAATTQNALQTYRSGHCLPANQFAIINQALTRFGAPPNAPYQGVVQCTATPSAGGLGPGQYLLGGNTTPFSGGAGLGAPFAGGYGPPSVGGPTAPISTPQGIFQWISGPDALRALLGSGQTIYAMPTAGNFVAAPLAPGEQYPYSGIPRYVKIAPPGTPVTAPPTGPIVHAA